MKKKKNIIIEIIILLTIIASIITIFYIIYEVNDTVPKESESNQIKNYSKDKHIKIIKDISNVSIYKVPEIEKIDNESSNYEYIITATDNYINTINEIIDIYYNEQIEEPVDKDTLINYCNSYNEIANNYKLICTYSPNHLLLKNTFYLESITTDNIITKKYKIEKDFNYNDKLDEYLNKLKNNNINYNEITNIE